MAAKALDLQRDALLAAGVNMEHLYEDHASDKRDDRPGLEACLKAVWSGDTLVAWKLDRLGRDLRHLVNLVGDLTQRGAGLRVWPARGLPLASRPPTAGPCSASSRRWPSSSAS